MSKTEIPVVLEGDKGRIIGTLNLDEEIEDHMQIGYSYEPLPGGSIRIDNISINRRKPEESGGDR